MLKRHSGDSKPADIYICIYIYLVIHPSDSCVFKKEENCCIKNTSHDLCYTE